MSGIRRGAVTPPASPPAASSRPPIEPPNELTARQIAPAEGLQISFPWALASTLPVMPGSSTTTSRNALIEGSFVVGTGLGRRRRRASGRLSPDRQRVNGERRGPARCRRRDRGGDLLRLQTDRAQQAAGLAQVEADEADAAQRTAADHVDP